MRVGLAQVAAPRDPAAAARVAADAVAACAADGARLVVLPEYASGFDPRGVGPGDAQELDGRFLTALRAAARGHGVDVLAGATLTAPAAGEGRNGRSDGEPGRDVVGGGEPGGGRAARGPGVVDAGGACGPAEGRASNAVVGGACGPAEGRASNAVVGGACGPAEDRASNAVAGGACGPAEDRASNAVVHVRADGTLGGTYRKVHLFDAFGQRESARFVPGDPAAPPLVVDADGLRLGVLTCFDLRFPESARRLVDAGAQAIVVPAAWAAGPGKVEQWTVLARARALENVAWLVGVGMAGRGVCGSSLVVDPAGAVVEQLGLAPGSVVVDLDPARVVEARRRNPALDLRRYEVRPR